MPARPDSIGSLTRVVHELTQRLARAYPLTVVSTHHPGDAEEERGDGIHHIRIPAGFDRALLGSYFRWRNRLGRRLGIVERPYPGTRAYFRSWALRAARRLARESPDLIHLHNVTQWIPPLRRATPSARLVLQMHCEWLVELPHAVIARRLADCDLVLGVSAHIVDQIREAFPAMAARCRVLHNGVSLDAFPPREQVRGERRDLVEGLRARYRLRAPVVLYVGRLSSEKGVHVLLEAFGRVRAKLPDATCLVVGPDWGPIRKVTDPRGTALARELARLDHGYMARLRGLAAPHGERVVFTGPVPNGELPLYHALADVMVAPSLLESFGIPPLEAAASGLPVVVSATGGLLDTVVAERTGVVVPPADPTALADGILRLLGDPGHAAALGLAGRDRVAARFTWDRIAATLAGYYDALLAVPRAA